MTCINLLRYKWLRRSNKNELALRKPSIDYKQRLARRRRQRRRLTVQHHYTSYERLPQARGQCNQRVVEKTMSRYIELVVTLWPVQRENPALRC